MTLTGAPNRERTRFALIRTESTPAKRAAAAVAPNQIIADNGPIKNLLLKFTVSGIGTGTAGFAPRLVVTVR